METSTAAIGKISSKTTIERIRAAQNSPLYTKLESAAQDGDLPVLRQLLAQHPEAADLETIEGEILLTMAACNAAKDGHLDVVKYLLGALKLPVNKYSEQYQATCKAPRAVDTMWKQTPLMMAILEKQEEIFLYILSLPDVDLNLDKRLSDGSTALHYVADMGDEMVMKELLLQGADIDAKNEQAYPPIILALTKGHVAVVRVLLAHYEAQGRLAKVVNSSIMATNGNSFLLLHYVVSDTIDEAKLAMLRLLVEAGADIWKEIPIYGDYEGTAFHFSAYFGLPALVEFFVNECGMPVNSVTADEQFTALHSACFCHATKEKDALLVVRVLVEKLGIDVNLKDFNDKTAADVALIRGRPLIYDYLTRVERAKAKAILAEREAAAKAAEEALLAELEEEEAKKAQKKEKNANKKKSGGGGGRQSKAGQSARSGGAGGGGRGSGGRGGGGSSSGVATVTEGIGSLAMADQKEEEGEEKKEEAKTHKVEEELPPPEAALTTPAPAKQR